MSDSCCVWTARCDQQRLLRSLEPVSAAPWPLGEETIKPRGGPSPPGPGVGSTPFYRMAALQEKKSCGQRMEEFQRYCWNPDTGQMLGRTLSRWGTCRPRGAGWQGGWGMAGDTAGQRGRQGTVGRRGTVGTAGRAGDGGGQSGTVGTAGDSGEGREGGGRRGGALRTCAGPSTSSPGTQDAGPARASGQAAPPSPDDPKKPFQL